MTATEDPITLTSWTIDGNIVGSELGYLDSLLIFTNTDAVVADEGEETIIEVSLTVISVTYDGG